MHTFYTLYLFNLFLSCLLLAWNAVWSTRQLRSAQHIAPKTQTLSSTMHDYGRFNTLNVISWRFPDSHHPPLLSDKRLPNLCVHFHLLLCSPCRLVLSLLSALFLLPWGFQLKHCVSTLSTTLSQSASVQNLSSLPDIFLKDEDV